MFQPTDPAVWSDTARIRADAPLIHNITNYVVMNLTANALLAVGASPVMAHAVEEVEDMARLARGLVLNMGTLSPGWVDAMLAAGRVAADRGIPVVFDPVGCGATPYRTQTAVRLADQLRPTIIRGNASEILALTGDSATTRGVDSLDSPDRAADAAATFARARGCVVSISGLVDLITDGRVTVRVHNGHAIMPRVTGMGCTATAITAAFAAVAATPLRAAVQAMTVMGVCGEQAASRAAGPGSFVPAFLDALWSLDELSLTQAARIEVALGEKGGA